MTAGALAFRRAMCQRGSDRRHFGAILHNP
jgi:hypothetical protein